MYELPAHLVLQQAKAQPRSGEELETFGKVAARAFLAGASPNLSESVVDTIKKAGLSPEQVKRVAEFANVAAYVDEFNKEGGANHYVDFQGGPADPARILQDLNDGGSSATVDRGMDDYKSPPSQSKHACAHGADGEKVAEADDPFWSNFLGGVEAPDVSTLRDPTGDYNELYFKLAGLAEMRAAELSAAENVFSKVAEALEFEVRGALDQGVSLGQVLTAWAPVIPSADYVKVAFAQIGPRLLELGVLDGAGMADSLAKTASEGMLNVSHPLVTTMREYCYALDKCASLRAERAAFIAHSDEVKKAALAPATFGWDAAKGVPHQLLRNLQATAHNVGKGVDKVAPHFVGEATAHAPGTAAHRIANTVPDLARKAVKGAIYAAPVVAGLEAAHATHDALRTNPYTNAVGTAVAAHVPGTREFYQERARVEQEAAMAQGQMYGGMY